MSDLSSQIQVIIPVFNALTELRECISRLKEYWTSVSITCVNDQSGPETSNFLEECKELGLIKLLYTPSRSLYTAAVNQGLRSTTAPFVLVLNSDVWLLPNALDELYRCATQHHAGIVGMKLLNEEGKISHAGAYGIGYHYGMNETPNHFVEEGEVEWISGSGLFIRRAVFDAIGYLDTRFVHVGSDREFGIQARRAGFSVWYCPTALGTHLDQRSADDYSKQAVEQQRQEGRA